jgi:hypothetical protein
MIFTAHGPFAAPFYQGKAGRTVTPSVGNTFWKSHPAIALEKGCYVFAMRSGGGILPTYVGKATVNFGQETFTDHKCGSHYNLALANYSKGRPVLFFVFHPRQKGPTNKPFIGALETYLIEQAYWRNPVGLTNKNKLPKHLWSIAGTLRPDRGKPSQAAIDLRTLLGIG